MHEDEICECAAHAMPQATGAFTLTCMRTKYVSVLIVHVLNLHVGVWSAGVEKTI